MNWMNEDLQKELLWAFGTLVVFIAFLLLGGINEVSEIASILKIEIIFQNF